MASARSFFYRLATYEHDAHCSFVMVSLTRLISCRAAAVGLLVGALLAACGGADLVLPADGRPARIQVVQGDGQSGQAGALLANPVIVEVRDARGQVVEGATVVFELTSAGDGAEVVPQTATTDATGRASARMLLGTKTGIQTGEARVVIDTTTAAMVSFSAVALPGTPNRVPRADYNWHCEQLTCQFTDASSDDDGSVTAWDWRFGDGERSTDREPSHTYAGSGTYTVTLTVTDNDGATDETQAQVTASAEPSPPNKPPHAEFEVHCSALTCSFIDTSKDDDGNIVQWLWNFGDGTATSTERNPVHTYRERGHYDVTLTVTDDGGAADIKTHRADPKM